MSRRNQRLLIWSIIAFQGVCTAFFLLNFYYEVFSPSPNIISWQLYEFIEIGAIIGLLLGFIFGALLAKNLLRRNHIVERQLRIVSGEFSDLLDESFEKWGFSSSEKDVALFAIKGMSNSEIAELRGTSEGTVKSQMNAVYKKAGLENRTQLLSHFFEELLADKSDAAKMQQKVATL